MTEHSTIDSPATTTGNPTTPLVLYDGDCGFCNLSVRFILDHERTPAMHFAPLQGPTAKALLAESPLPPDIGKSTIVFYESRSFAVRSRAVLRIMNLMGGPWRALALAGRVIPTPLADALYRMIARMRGKLPAKDSCELLTTTQRDRFLP